MKLGYRIKHLLVVLLAVSTLVGGITGASHAQAAYGTGTFGECEYGKETCTPSTSSGGEHTVQDTPDGLAVAVNLKDGQVIPGTGYDIEITPLNGQGDTFAEAKIYLGGQLVATIQPDADGTGRWFWNTTKYPSPDVRIVVSDSSGGETTFRFTVSLAREDQASGTPTTTTGDSGGIAGFVSGLSSGARDLIRQLPPPVVYAFPYMLFILLLGEIIVLLLQAKREYKELRTLQALAAREREIADMKKTFMELMSHYLRTPLTVMRGGIELLSGTSNDAALLKNLQAGADTLSHAIEAIIQNVSERSDGAVVNSQVVPPLSKKRYLAVWIPVVLVAVLAGLFIYLANGITEYKTSLVSLLIQIIVFSGLALIVFQLVRRWQLHRRDITTAHALLEKESVVQTSRDAAISEAATSLKGELTKFEAIAAGVTQTGPDTEFLSRGITQLREVVNKFVIATQLRGSHSTAVPENVATQQLFEEALSGVKAKADAKQVTVRFSDDTRMVTQSPSLMALVMQTLLDNAVDYSPEKSSVDVTARARHGLAEVHITDHGPGVSPEKQTALFQPFYKVEGAETFSREGMGFSLYLDKLIMTYLGGDIAMTSDPKNGTTVTLKAHAANS